MRRIIVLVCLFALTGCATIIGKGGYESVTIKSKPAGAKFEIFDREGNNIANGTTPQAVSLDKELDWFERPVYNVVVEKEGYDKKEVRIKGSVGGWYIGGNLFCGGLIGWLIVDPLTGAMWTLPDTSNTTLSKKTSSFFDLDQKKPTLVIVLKEEIPKTILKEIRPHMKLVN